MGLGVTEILMAIGILGGLIAAYTSLNVRIASLEVKVKTLDSELQSSINGQETVRRENREEHQMIMDKLDKLIAK